MISSKVQKLPAAVFLSEEFHGQRSLAGYSPGGCKESDNNSATEHRTTAYIKITN